MEIHILFTGVGRRVELVQAFRQAALCMNVNLKIYGADMTGTAPALSYCDVTRKVCGMKEPKYISQLVDICEKDKIDLLIPTIDTDLLVLSENVDKFSRTKVLISKPDKIAICRDKNYTADFFVSCGCKAPRTYHDTKDYQDNFPCFIKPKDGSSSIDAFKAENRDELEMYASQISDYVIQPFIEGTEYTVDAFCGFEGNPIYITPRIRLQVRAGEVLKTQIRMDDQIIVESRRIIEKFKPVGPITIQLIRKADGEDYFIEINPRFGGGSPLSMKAGARSAEVALKLLQGENVVFSGDIDDNAVFSRFDQSVCIADGDRKQPIKGVIFDLDDTLYSEKQYVRSGYKAVAEYLNEPSAEDRLWQFFEQGKPAIDAYLEEVGQLSKKADCLRIYREHFPQISLYDDVEQVMSDLRKRGIKVGIITDGRPDGQRNKICALGLDTLIDDIIITDELGGIQFRKPNDISFRIIQCRWRIPFEQMMYVGDNSNKDFQAPKQLGIRSVYYKNPDGLYTDDGFDATTIKNISEIMEKGKII